MPQVFQYLIPLACTGLGTISRTSCPTSYMKPRSLIRWLKFMWLVIGYPASCMAKNARQVQFHTFPKVPLTKNSSSTSTQCTASKIVVVRWMAEWRGRLHNFYFLLTVYAPHLYRNVLNIVIIYMFSFVHIPIQPVTVPVIHHLIYDDDRSSH